MRSLASLQVQVLMNSIVSSSIVQGLTQNDLPIEVHKNIKMSIKNERISTKLLK